MKEKTGGWELWLVTLQWLTGSREWDLTWHRGVPSKIRPQLYFPSESICDLPKHSHQPTTMCSNIESVQTISQPNHNLDILSVLNI